MSFGERTPAAIGRARSLRKAGTDVENRLWYVLRNRSWAPFQYFSIYMMMAGAERMLIESIREHGISLYHFFRMEFSQAQMISLVLMILGIVGFVWGGMAKDRKLKSE